MTDIHLFIQSSHNLILSPRAYIDPNTGGMLFQMLAVILAIFSGIVFFFSRQLKIIFAKFRRKITRHDPEEIGDGNNQDQMSE